MNSGIMMNRIQQQQQRNQLLNLDYPAPSSPAVSDNNMEPVPVQSNFPRMDKEKWLVLFKNFLANNGQTYTKPPVAGGQTINMWDFFFTCLDFGGWNNLKKV